MKADKEGTPRPVKPEMGEIMKLAYETVQSFGPSNQAMINERLAGLKDKVEAVEKAGDMSKMQQAQKEPF
jgi:hypothetical protein